MSTHQFFLFHFAVGNFIYLFFYCFWLRWFYILRPRIKLKEKKQQQLAATMLWQEIEKWQAHRNK